MRLWTDTRLAPGFQNFVDFCDGVVSSRPIRLLLKALAGLAHPHRRVGRPGPPEYLWTFARVAGLGRAYSRIYRLIFGDRGRQRNSKNPETYVVENAPSAWTFARSLNESPDTPGAERSGLNSARKIPRGCSQRSTLPFVRSVLDTFYWLDGEVRTMGQIHELVAQHGRDTARKLVPIEEKRLVDLAADVLADEKGAAGFTYSGFCMASLPHRSLPDKSQWVRKSEDFSLIIEPGKLFRHGEEEGTLYGVPFGPRARVILLYLQARRSRPTAARSSLAAGCDSGARPHGDRARRQDVSSLPRSGSAHQRLHLTFAFKKHGREGFIR